MSLFIFDKDGTLIRGAGLQDRKVRNPLRPEEQMLKPLVFEKLALLREQGHKIAIASNMSAVAQGLITPERAEVLIRNCAAKVGGVDAIRFCCYSPKGRKEINGRPNPFARDDPCRKPHPGMILEIMAELGFPPTDTWMIGNAKVDEQAARNAGVYFIQAQEFFKSLQLTVHS